MKGLPWKNKFSAKVQPTTTSWNMKTHKDGILVDFSELPSPPKLELFTESGAQVDTKNAEYPEQCLAFLYIDPESTVLELGARYGSVSCIINKKLTDKNHQVSVEPDSTVWAALEENIKRNDCQITLHKGFVSRKTLKLLPFGYAATSVPAQSSSIQSTTVEDLETIHNLRFDTLVADCEGFLGEFFDEHSQLYDQLHTVIFEADYPQKCNYDKIRTTLKEHGFREIMSGFQNVFKK
jgi:FkbM family methyltransferase